MPNRRLFYFFSLFFYSIIILLHLIHSNTLPYSNDNHYNCYECIRASLLNGNDRKSESDNIYIPSYPYILLSNYLYIYSTVRSEWYNWI